MYKVEASITVCAHRKLSVSLANLFFVYSLNVPWFVYILQIYWVFVRRPGSSVGTVTELRAALSGIASQWGRDFPSFQTDPGAHPAFYTMGTGSFPGVKCGQGDHSPPSSAAVMEE